MADVLEVQNLKKQFGSFTAVHDISFALREGEILGLLGPNGAGKTTTIQMLLGVLTPTAGTIKYFGQSFREHREAILEKVNFSSTYTNLPWGLTVKQSLTFISYLYDIQNRKKRLAEVIAMFRLQELLNQQMDSLSAGQITRVNLAKAFINFPKVLLLDEPTASLDPEVAQYIREFLLEERHKYNISMLFTSHNMAEVETVCDRVIFINRGEILANDTPANLAGTIEICHVELLVKNPAAVLKFCTAAGLACRANGNYLTVDVSERKIAEFLQDLSTAGIAYEEISIEKPTLEDYFLEAVKQKHHEVA